jgi:hypothetical protein
VLLLEGVPRVVAPINHYRNVLAIGLYFSFSFVFSDNRSSHLVFGEHCSNLLIEFVPYHSPRLRQRRGCTPTEMVAKGIATYRTFKLFNRFLMFYSFRRLRILTLCNASFSSDELHSGNCYQVGTDAKVKSCTRVINSNLFSAERTHLA